MVGWHQWLSGHEFEQIPGIGDGQGSMVCFSPWGHKESDMTEWLDWTDPNRGYFNFINLILLHFALLWASLVAQMVKNLPAILETWVWSLDWEDTLEKSMATHSSILAWRIPMDRGTWGATVHGATKSQTHVETLFKKSIGATFSNRITFLIKVCILALVIRLLDT